MSYIADEFKDFQDGIRVVMLINRGVMNSNKGSKRWINKIITTDRPSWLKAVERLMALQDHLDDPDIRLYASVNSRKLDKAINTFKHQQLDILPEQKEEFYSHINDRFCSCLMKPENRDSKYFLIDQDSKTANAYLAVDKLLSDNNIKCYYNYSTKNGYHYIVQPFDVRLIEGIKDVSLQKDGLLLLRWLSESDLRVNYVMY